MRLCFVGWGDHVHLERWAGYFDRLGHNVTVISFTGRGRYPDGVRQFPLGLERRGMRWKVLRLRYLLWRLRPDLVHVHWAHFANAAAMAWAGPLVVTAWGSDVYLVKQRAPHLASRLIKGLSAAHAITCDSEDLAHHIRNIRGHNGPNIHVIQWGVDIQRFCPGSPDVTLLRDLQVSGRRVVFSARSFEPVYNQETVVSAFAIVSKQIPDAVLLMKDYNGDQDYHDKIRARIEHLGLSHAVRIVGTIPYEQLAGLYRSAAVTVSVPFSDSTPMTVLEAMACGSAPVVSDLASLREWIQEGWNGHLVSPHDSEQLSERIMYLLTHADVLDEYARRNRKIVEERASQDSNMARMEVIYRQVIAERQRLR